MSSSPSNVIKIPASTRTRHRFSAGFFFLFALFMAVLSLLPPKSGRSMPADWLYIAGMLGVIALFLALGTIFLGMSRLCLLVSPEGIEQRGFGFRIRTSWDNVERITLLPMSMLALGPAWDENPRLAQARWQQAVTLTRKTRDTLPDACLEGMLLREAVPHENAWWAVGMVKTTRILPLDDFKWWRYGELGRSLRQYAPRLLDVQELE